MVYQSNTLYNSMLMQKNIYYNIKGTPSFTSSRSIIPVNKPKVEILTGVSDMFIYSVNDALEQYPKSLMKKITDAGYKVVITPDLLSGLKSQGIYSEVTCKSYGTIDTVGLTDNINKIVYISEDIRIIKNLKITDIRRVVNHELSHAVVYIDKLKSKENFIKAVSKDRDEILYNKICQVPENMIGPIDYYFFDADHSFKEICADALAWGCKGGGCYGSKIMSNYEDEYFIRKLFPNVIRQLNKEYRNAGLVYRIY